jgi:hypothetical protein
MPHFSINGVPWPQKADSVEESPDEVGEADTRSLGGLGLSTRIARKRRWKSSTVIHTASEGEAWRRMVEGEGQSWGFNGTAGLAISSKGLGPSAGTFTTAGTGGMHSAGKVTPASASFVGWALARRLGVPGGWVSTKGWTILAWKKLAIADGGDGTTYFHHVVTGAVGITRGASANPAGVSTWRNGVLGSYGVGNWLSVGVTTSLWGFSDGNVAAAYDYSNVVVLPFVVPSAWVPFLYAFHAANAWPSLPRVRLGGDVVEDVGGVDVLGKATRIQQRALILAGSPRTNARVLELELREA